jgi:hypothetical protein
MENRVAILPGDYVEIKDTNPKDAIGIRKVGLSAVPMRVLWRVGLAMLEGACKYGRHNYRAVGVRGSVYFDACQRHLLDWWEGTDIDPDSELHHLDKALACLFVLRDSILTGNYTDDRPPAAKEDFTLLNELAGKLIDRHVSKKPTHYTIQDDHV